MRIVYSDAQLLEMLTDLESDRLERKSTFEGDAPEKCRQAVCAFANDLPGHGRPGVLFVGVDDAGVPTGMAITDRLLQSLSDMKTDGHMLPPPTLVVERRRLGGRDVAVVVVHPSDAPPVRYRGRIWIRVGPRRAIASAQDERLLNERRRHLDRPFDTQPLRSAALADLSRRRFEDEYLPAAFAPDILAANERSYEQRLAACKFLLTVEEPVPTVAGVLALAIRPRDHLPGAYAQFLRIGGTRLSDPILDEAAIDGPVSDLVSRIEDKLSSHNRVAVDLTSGPTERRSSSYPLSALQQLVRNAVLHRSYEGTNAPLRIVWFDDRIEIASPGGPFGQVTERNFGEPGVVDYRNPTLAEVLRTLGLVQRFGVGIETARAELRAAGHPPLEYRVGPERVVAVVSGRR